MTAMPSIPQQLDGVLLTDQRSAAEAVMLIWLTPALGSLIGRVLPRHAIVGALHITRGKTSGVSFDAASRPSLLAPDGRRIAGLQGAALTKDMHRVLDLLTRQLRSRQPGADLGGLADHLSFHVFETGDRTVGPDWAISYAGVSYPMAENPAQS